MTDKEKTLAFIEERIKWNEDMMQRDPKPSDIGRIEEAKCIRRFIDSLQEESVSIWHDANQHPEINTPILVRTYDNIVVSTKRYDDNLIPWEDRIKRDEITHWCYVEDLLKL
jgi:hypothetical protein